MDPTAPVISPAESRRALLAREPFTGLVLVDGQLVDFSTDPGSGAWVIGTFDDSGAFVPQSTPWRPGVDQPHQTERRHPVRVLDSRVEPDAGVGREQPPPAEQE